MSSLQNFKCYFFLIAPPENIRILLLKLRYFIVALTQKLLILYCNQKQYTTCLEKTMHILLQYWLVKDLTIILCYQVNRATIITKNSLVLGMRERLWTEQFFPDPSHQLECRWYPAKQTKLINLWSVVYYWVSCGNVLSNHSWLPCERRHSHAHKSHSCPLMLTVCICKVFHRRFLLENTLY